MLIRFTVENFLSFRDQVEFSSVASTERQHRERIAFNEHYALRLLPVAAMYGANASGKSNFVRALDFAKQMITRGRSTDQTFPVEPFRLAEECAQKPAVFRFEILADDGICYEYGFQLIREKVVEEHLYELTKTAHRMLFSRGDAVDISGMKGKLSAEDLQFLEFTARGTRQNQLFLTESVERNIDHFESVYRWFRNVLHIVYPDTTARGLEFMITERDELQSFSNMMLVRGDTGIHALETEDVPFETLDVPEAFREKIRGELKENVRFVLQDIGSGSRFSVRLEKGTLSAKRLISFHTSADGKSRVRFDLGEESQGTQRYVDLLPALYELSNTLPRVYVIDELDRTLHSDLTRSILTEYFESCSNTPRSQLIFTTHDQMLLDQSLFRRDEMWFVDRGDDGSSSLYSLSDFRGVRNDRDIRRSYRLGRYGGVPRIKRVTQNPRPKHVPDGGE